MKIRRLSAAVVLTLIWVVGPAHPALSTTPAPSSTQCSAADYDGDPRLGPAALPTFGPVGLELRNYDRFGGLTPQQFLSTYWDPAASGGQGGWRFPPANGFRIGPDGRPVEQVLPLRPGQRIDRYGSEFGAFLAPAGLPYANRAIPPQSLDNRDAPATCNYHLYLVVREFRVDGGPIAPGLGQPGGGVQYLLVSSLVPDAPDRINVMWLVAHGYLQRLI
jgi:hypothetical protein